MAQLKDLIVNGASRLIGDAFANKLQITTLADSANSIGTNGQVLKSDGSKIVWGSDNNTTYNFSGTTFYSGNSGTAEHNANNALKNGNYYYSSNGPATTLGASTADGGLYVQSYSDSWVGQIAQDYRDGQLFVRGKNNGTWQNWYTIPKFTTTTGGLGGASQPVYIDTSGNLIAANSYPTTLPASDVSAWAKAANKPSYAWNEITDKPSSFTPSSHTHYELTTIGDKRNDATTPNTYANKLIFQGLKYNNKIGSPATDTYSYLIGLRGWSDSSGGNSHEIAFNNNGLFYRNGATTTWGSWKQLAYTDSNITGTATTATTASKLSTNAGSQLNPVYFSGGVPVASTGNSIPFIVGTGTTAGTWLGSLTGLTAYYDGLLILYKSPVAGASTTTLNLNSLGAKTIYINNTSKLTTHFPANQPILLTYSTSQNSGCWMCLDDYWTNSDTYTSAYCGTAAGTVAKAATCTYWTATPKSYIHITFRYANTAANPTLNIASTGAKPIYVNGVRATGSVLPAGSYIAYYDGTNYQFRTDGFLPGEGSRQLKFLNTTVPTSAWVDDATYTQYPKKADITCTGVTSDMYGDVIFNVTEAVSGNFAPVAATGNNKVTIWAQDTPTTDIVIPTIVIF